MSKSITARIVNNTFWLIEVIGYIAGLIASIAFIAAVLILVVIVLSGGCNQPTSVYTKRPEINVPCGGVRSEINFVWVKPTIDTTSNEYIYKVKVNKEP